MQTKKTGLIRCFFMASCLGELETSAGHAKTKAHALQRLISIESVKSKCKCAHVEKDWGAL